MNVLNVIPKYFHRIVSIVVTFLSMTANYCAIAKYCVYWDNYDQ